MMSKGFDRRTTLVAIAGILLSSLVIAISGQTGAKPAVAIDNDDIGGVVTGRARARGGRLGDRGNQRPADPPHQEASSPTIGGAILVPDLPKANYDVWVRGYGLVDSPKVKATPGKTVNLKAVAAPDKKAAAQYYPAQYWFSLLQMPPKSDFPGTGDTGNGIAPNIRSQGEWIRQVVNTDGCTGCHQMGGPATRAIPKSILGESADSKAAWDQRIQVGQAGGGHERALHAGRPRSARWRCTRTGPIGSPPASCRPPTPSRPQGRERNVVDHDVGLGGSEGLSARRDRERQAQSDRQCQRSDLRSARRERRLPAGHRSEDATRRARIKLTVRDPETPSSASTPPAAPSPYWGDEAIWNSQTTVHSFAMDKQARVWAAARVRKPADAGVVPAGSDHPSAKLFPINQGQRGLELYDPKTKQTTTIDTCFTWGHVNFDDNDVLWSSFGPAGVEGWFDTKIWDKTHDEKQAQGWSAFVLDYNGNGKRDAYTEPNQPADPTKDKRLNVQFYGDSPASDGSVWGSVQGMPGALVRFVPGAHPPETALAEYYEVPWNNPKASVQGFAPRGMDVDSKGVVWTVLSSGHLASFDRSKCKGPLNGPTAATGQHCPEGWTLYPLPGPNYKGAVENGSADSAYYDFVDRFDMLGVGKDVPIATGNLSEGLLALVDGKFMTLRVPYPMGFFAKGMDGRIDNPNGGWKGKGIFTTYRDASAVPHGRRQGQHEQAREVPDAAGSALEVNASTPNFQFPTSNLQFGSWELGFGSCASVQCASSV